MIELKKHGSDYHHRTDPAVMAKIESALATLQPSGERREAIAQQIEPWAWAHKDSGKGMRGVQGWIDSSLDAADLILASGLVQDEAAIRADEREKCAKIVESNDVPIAYGVGAVRSEIASRIRSARTGGEG